MSSLTYLDAVITISKVVHWFELLVDNANAGFVRPIGDRVYIFGALAHAFEFLVDALRTLNRCLRVKLSYLARISEG